MYGLDYFCTINKWKLGEVADYLGIKQTAINGWKNGEKNFPDKHKIKIAELFQIPEDKIYLLSKRNIDDLDKVNIELIFNGNCLNNAIGNGSSMVIPLFKTNVILLQRQKKMYEVLKEIEEELKSTITDTTSNEFDKKLKEIKSVIAEFKLKQTSGIDMEKKIIPNTIEDMVNEVFEDIAKGKVVQILDWDLDRIYVEIEGQSYCIRMRIIDEHKIRWTLFIDIPDEDGGSHGEPIKEGLSDYNSSNDERKVTFNISEWEEKMKESKFVSLVLNFLKDEIVECDGADEGSITVDLRNCNYYVMGYPWWIALKKLLKENGYDFSLGGGDDNWTTISIKL